jgi:iron complex outermembrane receptor protein
MNKFTRWGYVAAYSAASLLPALANTAIPEQKYPTVDVKDAPLEYRQFEKVEITGSAILAKEAKQALPLQVIGRRDIERSGASNLAELLHQLPVMLNFQEQGTMTGSVSGGPEAAAIHGYQSGTLVLLNGRRLPFYGSQTISGERAIVDLNIVPLMAIDRVEILTDGSSSRYGSDAVAGVVNIITKNHLQGVQVSAQHTSPRGSVANGQQLSLSWGRGKTEQDGYSLQAHFNAERQGALLAGDRRVSKDSLHRFTVNGQEYFDTIDSNQLYTPYGAPGYNRSTDGVIHNIYLDQYGHCHPGSYTLAGSAQTHCYNNIQSHLTIYPATDKKQIYLRGEKFISPHWIGFAEILGGQYTQDSVAYGYTEFMSILPDGSAALMTAEPLGLGRQRYQNKMHQGVIGVRGDWNDWSIKSSLSRGQHQVEHINFARMAEDGSATFYGFPLTPEEILQDPKQYSAQTLAKFDALKSPTQPSLYGSLGHTTLTSLDMLASKEILDTDNGPASLGLGLTARTENILFVDRPVSPDSLSFSGKRLNTAVFAELQSPLTASLEASLSVRRDQYSDFGGVTTSKVGGKWKAADTLFFRGSMGNGFRAPTLGQMVNQSFFKTAINENGQWIPVYFQGNPHLQPEKSTQVNVGFRLEPSKQWSLGLDWWQLRIQDTFGNLPADKILLDANLRNQYLITKDEMPAILSPNVNLGRAHSRGIDYDVQWRMPTDWGVLRWSLKGTHFLQSERQFSDKSAWLSDLGQFSRLSYSVTPRNQLSMRMALDQGDWSAQATINYRSGNTESTTLATADHETIPYVNKVPAYSTLDLGGRWKINTHFTLSVLVTNLLDKEPPLRLLTSGVLQGVDTRYANYYGRTLKLKAEYKF